MNLSKPNLRRLTALSILASAAALTYGCSLLLKTDADQCQQTADCIAKGQELRAAGITEISIFITSQDEAGSHQVLRRFAEEVIPFV